MKRWFGVTILITTIFLVSAFAVALNSGGETDSGLSPAPRAAVTATSSSGCGSSGGCGTSASGASCCGGPASGQGASRASADWVKAYLQSFYTKALGEGVTVELTDFGCHQEAEIRLNNRAVKRLSISGGTITDIT